MIVKLKNIISEIRDGTHGTHERVNNGIPFLSAKNVHNNGLKISDSESMVSEEEASIITSNGFPIKDDILFTCVGTIGRCSVYELEHSLPFQRSVAFLRPQKTLVSPKYLKYSMQAENFQEKLLLESKQTAQAGVYMGDIREQKIKLPSLLEQNEVVNFLDGKIGNTDLALSKLKAKLSHLDEYKTALIHNAVTKGLDANGCRILDGTPAAEMKWKDSGVEWIGDVPEGWDSGKVKESIYFTCGGEVIDKSHWDEEGDEVLYTASQNPLMSSFKNFPSEKRATKNDVLIARNGNGAIHLPSGGEIFTNVVQKISINAGYDRRFVAHFLSLAKKYEIAKCYGDIIASLNMEFWSNCPLMKCEMTEQLVILNYLDSQVENVNKAKQAINKKIALLNEYKKSLINEAVSGEMVVQERMIREKC